MFERRSLKSTIVIVTWDLGKQQEISNIFRFSGKDHLYLQVSKISRDLIIFV